MLSLAVRIGTWARSALSVWWIEKMWRCFARASRPLRSRRYLDKGKGYVIKVRNLAEQYGFIEKISDDPIIFRATARVLPLFPETINDADVATSLYGRPQAEFLLNRNCRLNIERHTARSTDHIRRDSSRLAGRRYGKIPRRLK